MTNQRSAWSTKRAVNRTLKALSRLGCDNPEIRGYTVPGSSTYIWAFDREIRVSDHDEAAWGGYDVTRGERHPKSHFSISPHEHSVDELIWWLMPQISFDAIDCYVDERFEDVMQFGHS